MTDAYSFVPAWRAGFEELAYALFQVTGADQLFIYRCRQPGEPFDPAFALGALSLQEKQFFWGSQLAIPALLEDFQPEIEGFMHLSCLRSQNWLIYRLENRGTLLGVVLAGWLAERKDFPVKQAQILARTMALELDAERLYEHAHQLDQQSVIAQETTQAILRRDPMPEILRFIAGEGMRALDALGCAIWLYQEDGELARMVQMGQEAVSPLARGAALSDEQKVKPFLVHPENEQINEFERGQLLVIPLLNGQKTVGFFELLQIEAYAQPKDLATARDYASQAAVAIELDHLYQRMQKAAAAEERARLARDLHDSVTQSLYAMTLYTHAAQRQLRDGNLDSASNHIQVLGITAREALGEMRLLIYELRPQGLEQYGLRGVLEQRLQSVEARSGLEIQLEYGLTDPLPSTVEEHLYRIALESLNNVIKHAQAGHVWVSLTPVNTENGDRMARLSVRDDGSGFDPQDVQSGVGLKSIRERVEEIHGRLEIATQPGSGVTVTIEVPYG